jgi:predicted DNA-binding protein YlxM (UPF0122 family)
MSYEKYTRAIRKMRAFAELQNKQLHQDCQAYIDGKIKTQAEIARKHGVTRACISKRVSLMRPLLTEAIHDLVLLKAREQKRKIYGLRQMIVAAARKSTRITNTQKATESLWRIDYD